MVEGPTIAAIERLRDSLGGDIDRTPMLRCAAIDHLLGGDTRVFGKLEFLQRTGTFKARGALAVLKSLNDEQRAAGVTAVSAGNHAIATAFAARAVGASAKVDDGHGSPPGEGSVLRSRTLLALRHSLLEVPTAC